MATPPAADALHRQQMQALLESGQFSDVTLVVGHEKKEFKTHRCLLASFSPVFTAMFSHAETKEAQEKRVVIEDVSAQTMHHLLTFFYTGVLKVKRKKVTSLMDLLAAVDKYQVSSLKGECESKLGRLITYESLLHILLCADQHNALTLKERCLYSLTRCYTKTIHPDDKTWLELKSAFFARPELIQDILYRMAGCLGREPMAREPVSLSESPTPTRNIYGGRFVPR